MMPSLSKNRVIVLVLVLAALGLGIGLFFLRPSETPEVPVVEMPEEKPPFVHAVIGTSGEGRSIDAYTYGDGENHLLFVGGVHGGYEWNSVLLAYEFMDYFEENPDIIPSGVRLTVIPSANPDGVYAVVGAEGRFAAVDVPAGVADGVGRLNANDVDLNRNFDCKWQPESMWRGTTVNAGTSAFSEPEAQAIRDFVVASDPSAVVFWHSQSNAVYASECEAGVLPQTLTLMNTYAGAAGYPAVESFDFYEITGDAEGWLASINIPAITVELATHESIEWAKNLEGVTALLSHYAP